MTGKYITDFHTHLLPEIDDGSRNVETTIRMLEAEYQQGVGCVIATPHFCGWKHRIDEFVAERQRSMDKISEITEAIKAPEIIMGAEVEYFPGICRSGDLEKLAIEGTKVILIEMPFEEWSDTCVKEIISMKDAGWQIVLAHIERYMDSKKNVKALDEMREKGILMQINTGSVCRGALSRRLIRMIGKGQVHLLGSDCHSMNHRPPNMEAGREIIERKLGQAVLDNIDRRAAELIRGEKR
ncbi:MAG: capsular polysaccharide biosynthesis protein [Clostridia bacterium]|nr:capsular polysaccharide biosynthesis protein [Clostridia bacterium]